MENPQSSQLVVTMVILAAAMMLIVIGALSNLGLPSYALILAGILLAIFATIRFVALERRKQG